jgi:hypothetical protein
MKLMKQTLKKGLPIALATALALSYGVDSSLANGKPDHAGHKTKTEHKVKFKGLLDIEGYWGQESIEKMNALGVIQGYMDGSFQPNKPVNQQEAVVMVVRLLGLEEEAEKRALAGVNLPFKNRASIASWAYGHIDVALELGIIDGGHVFQGNKAASRMYVTSMMIKGLGLELTQYAGIDVGFSDIMHLTAEEKLQLVVAVTTQLANGYGDKKFHPNKPVTRGEMAAFLERMKKLIGDNDEIFRQHIKGLFTNVNITSGTITMQAEVTNSSDQKVWETRSYLLQDGYSIYYDSKKRSNLDLFKAEDKIEIVLNKEGKVIFIKGESKQDENEIWENLEGISTFDLELASGANKINYKYDVEKAEEIYVLSQINGQSSLITGKQASLVIKGIVDTHFKEESQFNVKTLSAALANSVKENTNSASNVKLNYDTETKKIVFDVQIGSNSEATILNWSKGDTTVTYTQTKDQNNKVVTHLVFKDPTNNNEVTYHKEVNGTTVTATGIVKVNGVTITIVDTSLEPTIASLIAHYKLQLSF